jgi:Tfp pilus assembly protein PilN
MEMINLLPPEEKRQLRAARTNVLLLRYNILLLAAIAFSGLAVGITYVYLTTAKANAIATINDNNTKVGQYADVQVQASRFRQNLATAKQILAGDVTYSKVILQIAHLLPSGVILENLNLDAQTFGTETSLVAQAKDYGAAIALKDSLQKSTLFSDVHFQSIAANTSGTASAYPITVNLSVTFKKDAAK